MDSQLIIILLSAHFIFDFVLQSHKMSVNKSTSFKWLFYHVAVYSLWGLLVNPIFYAWLFITHACIDTITSRITKILWSKQNYHYFFVVIGLDQLIHYLTIFYGFEFLN
jgi:hypothetical protein